MITHELKTWPEFFEAVWDGKKLFDLRKNDRNFRVGDQLCLREWNPATKEYTSRHVYTSVTFVLAGGHFGLPEDLVILSLDPKLNRRETVYPPSHEGDP